MRKAIKPCAGTFSFRFLAHDVAKIILALPGWLWFRTRILYETPAAKRKIRGGVLAISNHLGFYDPIYLQYAIWYRRHHFVCLQKFFEGPLWWMFKAFLCIPIDKENVSIQTFKDIVAHLRCNELVSLFPEGQVEGEGAQMSPFKSGMILMAIQSRKPILPVYIRKRERFYHRLTVCIGEPIDPAALCGERPTMQEINRAAERLQEKMTALSRLGKV